MEEKERESEREISKAKAASETGIGEMSK